MKIEKELLSVLFYIGVIACGSREKEISLKTALVYDGIVNGYQVSGDFYPFSSTSQTGQVVLRFAPVNGGDTLVFSNVGCLEEYNSENPAKFTGKNLCDYVFSEEFSGFHDGDTLLCHYYDTMHPEFDSPFLYDAEFQFIDIDFDGEEEFLINDYSRGQCGNQYVAYEISGNGFVLKEDYPFNCLTSETKLLPETKQIYLRVLDDLFDTVDISYYSAPLDDVKLDTSNIAQQYVNSVRLYEDNGAYTNGLEFQVDTTCWVYSYSEVHMQGDVPIQEEYTYYIPLGEPSYILRRNSYSGEGYHGGHMVILKEETDLSFDYIRKEVWGGKLLVQNKTKDIVARAFERYCIQHSGGMKQIDHEQLLPSLEEQVGRRKTEMIEGAKHCFSNTDMWEYVEDATHELEDTGKTFQGKVENLLDGNALKAFRSERESFSAWYAFQQTFSAEVIGDIWELFVGGSAGGSFQEIHLYDIANVNATDQSILYDVLTKNTSFDKSESVASTQQVDSAQKELNKAILQRYSQYENIGPDGWPRVKNNPEQIRAFLDKDLALFKKWMAARDAVEPLLENRVRPLYSSHSAYWKYLYLQKIQEYLSW